MKTALLAACLTLVPALAWAADPPRTQSKPDTRSDYLRSESVKGDGKAAGKIGAVLDINLASENELAALPGIGAEGARKIVKGRPYKTKDELVRRKILSDATYAKVEDILIARGRDVSPAK